MIEHEGGGGWALGGEEAILAILAIIAILAMGRENLRKFGWGDQILVGGVGLGANFVVNLRAAQKSLGF